MASEIPLILYECEFDELKFEPELSSAAYMDLLSHLRVRCRRTHMASLIWHVIYGSVAANTDLRTTDPSKSVFPQVISLVSCILSIIAHFLTFPVLF
jgi:hypothetical protein